MWFPRCLPVVDGGKDTGEKEVVFELQMIDEESIDPLSTPTEGVPLLKQISAKSVECEANRSKFTDGTDGYEDHITATVRVGARGNARSKTIFDMLFSVLGSTLARVPHTCRDGRVGGQIVSEAFMFATCGTIHLVGYKGPMTKAFVVDKGLEGTSMFIPCSIVQGCIENEKTSLKASEKEADHMADFADASVFPGANECAAKLLDGAALLEEAKAELNRITVANTTKKNSSRPLDCA